MRGALQRGQPACLVTPSHLNVVGWRSLRRRPALPRNFRVPPSCAPPQASRPASNLPREPGPGGLRRGRTHPQLWRPRGETVEEPRHPPPAGEGSPTPHWSSLRPMGFSRDVVCPCPPVWMGSVAGGVGWGEETPPLLLPWAYLGIIKSATGKRTAGATGLLNPKHGPQLSQRARVILGRMVAK